MGFLPLSHLWQGSVRIRQPTEVLRHGPVDPRNLDEMPQKPAKRHPGVGARAISTDISRARLVRHQDGLRRSPVAIICREPLQIADFGNGFTTDIADDVRGELSIDGEEFDHEVAPIEIRAAQSRQCPVERSRCQRRPVPHTRHRSLRETCGC